MSVRLSSLPVLAAAALVVLSGCASTPTTEPTALAPTEDVVEIEADAAWLDGGRMIGLVTWGSSSCVPTVEDTAMLDNGTLVVSLLEPEEGTACTRDLAPRVTLVDVPEAVDPTRDLEIEVTGSGIMGDAELDGVAGLASGGETDYLPSAGWVDEDGMFVVLTWGSSGCPPVLQDAVATGPAEVTVTFENPPADQVCTADMAPRSTLVTVDGVEKDAGAVAILTGSSEFAAVRVDIIGGD
ncbi:hypothetical protein ACIGCK_01005 [Microbacterium sp. NPDC078428]|uniref:hypothetical protein n=1 Tax=Microbacterium sp. NPDC078428 TaxID=3364190 RepID=UPI0037CB136C